MIFDLTSINREIMPIFARYGLCEKASVDECYLDLTEAARRLHKMYAANRGSPRAAAQCRGGPRRRCRTAHGASGGAAGDVVRNNALAATTRGSAPFIRPPR